MSLGDAPFQGALKQLSIAHSQQVRFLQGEITQLNQELKRYRTCQRGSTKSVDSFSEISPTIASSENAIGAGVKSTGPDKYLVQDYFKSNCQSVDSLPKEASRIHPDPAEPSLVRDVLTMNRKDMDPDAIGEGSSAWEVLRASRRRQSLRKKQVVVRHKTLPGESDELQDLSCAQRVADTISNLLSCLGRPQTLRVGRVGRRRSRLVSKVTEDMLEVAVAVSIIVNGVMTAFQTDYIAENLTDKAPPAFNVAEMIFCVIFTVEILIRLCRHGRNFFFMTGRFWNWFDALLVALQWIEFPLLLIMGKSSDSAQSANLTSLRLVRILRLLRIMRMIRILQFCSDISVVTSAIANSMRSLLATTLLLLLTIIAVGIVFTQVISTHRIGLLRSGQEDPTDLRYFWGSLPRSVLSLLESILGGVDWDNTLIPLLQVSPILGVVFLGYICFSLIAMFNVITGIFVEAALKKTERSKDEAFAAHVRNLFCLFDADDDTHITREEYNSHLDDPHMQMYMVEIGIDPGEARILWDFLDCNGSNHIDIEMLLTGLIRLRAGAKFMDLLTIMHEIEQQNRKWEDWRVRMEFTLNMLTFHLKDISTPSYEV
mmetsp:Transcript_27764/g.62758  ORF Transcript_27764/g.62758 Transcript_27764/m.62758 type:complete len:599 (-) Transcript_27764:99-1895(-)